MNVWSGFRIFEQSCWKEYFEDYPSYQAYGLYYYGWFQLLRFIFGCYHYIVLCHPWVRKRSSFSGSDSYSLCVDNELPHLLVLIVDVVHLSQETLQS